MTQTTATGRLKGRRRVEFSFPAGPEVKQVHIAGSFNDWNPKGRKLVDPEGTGVFKTAMLLEPGSYQYKFVVNGEEWRLDPENQRFEFGGGCMNSAIIVQPSHLPAVAAD